MKTIADIKIYKSDIENIDGNSLPSDALDKKMNIAIARLVMKLREANFYANTIWDNFINRQKGRNQTTEQCHSKSQGFETHSISIGRKLIFSRKGDRRC